MAAESQAPDDVQGQAKWQVQLTDGTIMGRFTPKEIADGLRSGWLRPEDKIRPLAGQWHTLQTMDGQLGFHVAMCLNPQNSYREEYSANGVVLLTIAARIAAWYIRFMFLPDLGLLTRLVLATGSLVVFIFVLASPWNVPGLVMKVIGGMIGLSIVAGIAGVDARALLQFVFSLGTFLDLFFFGGLGALIGWGMGNMIGAWVGGRRAPMYTLPAERTLPPAPQPQPI